LNGHGGPKATGGRRLVRAMCLIAAVAAQSPAAPCDWAAAVVPALSPFVAIASLSATWTFGVWMPLGLAVGVICLARRRWFCRWVCPTGFCADGAGRLGLRWTRRCPRLPPVGQWIALATLAGACLGYPLLLWLDPLALFTASFGALGPSVLPAAYCGAIALAVVLLASLLWPGVWCMRLCPLGGLLDILALPAAAIRARAGASTRVRDRANPLESPADRPEGWPLARRVLLAGAVGTVCAAVARKAGGAAPRPLRPPGARVDGIFTGLCVRCGNCVRACPAGIVGFDLGQRGVAGLLAPALHFDADYCREDCARCTLVCPSGALTRLATADKLRHPIGLPRVDMSVCLLGDDRECWACRNRCPFDAITMVFSEKEYSLTPRIDAAKCPGCGACEAACPTSPRKAIVVHPL
jgi:ferredoxin-type protein NapF